MNTREVLESTMRTAGRLPPGQSATEKFPVLHYGGIPAFNESTWDFRVWGGVEQELRLSWTEFSALPRTQVRMDIHCVTRWSKFDTLWEGVALRTLLESGLIRLQLETRFVIQHAEGGYSTNLPLEVALQENFLLATHFNNAPLTPDHGFPLRGVVGAIPGRSDPCDVYLWKGAKWLRSLEFVSQDRLGFWEQAGYHNAAGVWQEQRLRSE